MKILLAGDTHGNLAFIKMWLIPAALDKECDKIFVLGDFGYWEHTQEGVNFLDELEEDLATFGPGVASEAHPRLDLYFLDGNHDNRAHLLEHYTERDDEGFILVRPHIRYADRGHVFEWGGVRFMAVGGAYSVDKDWRLKLEGGPNYRPGELWFPGEELTDEEATAIVEARPWMPDGIQVMLTHDKPLESKPRWNRKDLPPCIPNQRRLSVLGRFIKPEYWFHGHLHYKYRDSMVWEFPTIDGWELHTVKVLGLDCDATDGSRTDTIHLIDTETMKGQPA